MSSFRIFIGILSLFVSLSAQAANYKAPKYFLSYEQLSALSRNDQIEYLKTYSEAVVFAEKRLNMKSTESASRWPLEVQLFDKAVAEDNTIASSSCVNDPSKICGFAGNQSCRGADGKCKIPLGKACTIGAIGTSTTVGVTCASYLGTGLACVPADNNATNTCKTKAAEIQKSNVAAKFNAVVKDSVRWQTDYEGGMRLFAAACEGKNLSGKNKEDCQEWKERLQTLKSAYCTQEAARNLDLCTGEEMGISPRNSNRDQAAIAGGVCGGRAVGVTNLKDQLEVYSGANTSADSLKGGTAGQKREVSCSCSGPKAAAVLPALSKYMANNYCDIISPANDNGSGATQKE